MNKVPLTARGAEKLQAELKKLKSEDRPRIIQAIAEARAHGDLKENAEYHAAKEQQSFAEGRIQEIEAKLSNAQIIDVTSMTNNGKVIFGATVELLDLEVRTRLTSRKDESRWDHRLRGRSLARPQVTKSPWPRRQARATTKL